MLLGIQRADIRELMSTVQEPWCSQSGIWQRLQVCRETLELLAENGIQVEVLQTEAAVERFNMLRENMPVGGLFHSTC
jgi:hypothetical protein